MLSSFEQINPDMHERISYVLGGRYDTTARLAVRSTRRERSPSHAGSLPQPAVRRGAVAGRFRLSRQLRRVAGRGQSGRVGAEVSPGGGGRRGAREQGERESGESGRECVTDASPNVPDLGREYLEMVEDGVIAAQYVRGWQEVDRNAVLLAPAHTFLMMNRPVDYQFWLDIGSRGWFERLYQPLTQPYVLSRHWQPGRPVGSRRRGRRQSGAALPAGGRVVAPLSQAGLPRPERAGRAGLRTTRPAALGVQPRAAAVGRGRRTGPVAGEMNAECHIYDQGQYSCEFQVCLVDDCPLTAR